MQFRLQREIASMPLFKSDLWTAVPRADDIRTWDCLIRTHENSKFGVSEISVTMTLPYNYPMHPPRIKINTPIVHACVSDGLFTLFAADEWTPAYSIPLILLIIATEFNIYDDAMIRQQNRTHIIRYELIGAVLNWGTSNILIQ